ncbi:SOS response-associated peptidase [Cohnella massiliensis]|uniref:SOS response-associated peptidase n=1 Tax=Cohnella massiliensis TaxID=1816691 RepID=UPI0009BB5B9E|nr:SOS response-associated peptidase [Cohnella massiliensis]
MCQRFSLTAELPELSAKFGIGRVESEYRPRYNISPTQTIPIIVEDGSERVLFDARWGFIPYWSKDAVNADGRSVGDRSIFKRIVNKQRCVIPCSGFYGWMTSGKVRQPVRFVFRDRRTFAVPGFYEVWPRVYEAEIRACTMVTTAASGIVQGYADRMPALLDEDGIDAWLSEGNVEYRKVFSAVRELSERDLDMYPVGAFVNDAANESPACAEPIQAAFAALRR